MSAMASTLILRTEAGYLAAIVRGDTRLSYKKIKQKLGLKNVSLAAPEQVKQLTGSEVGHVALVNHGLTTIVDERVTEERRFMEAVVSLNIHFRFPHKT
jgi:prolyl-tRNA editing enzyme YbaK/EbsC (Cys-tRNA(Pro) deacylase)